MLRTGKLMLGVYISKTLHHSSRSVATILIVAYYKGQKLYKFWDATIKIIYAGGSMVIVWYLIITLTDNYDAIVNFGISRAPTWVAVTTVLWMILTFAFVIMVGVSAVFTFFKIVKIIFQTSAKLVKLLRTDDRYKVHALRRKVYFYVWVLPLPIMAAIPDFIFNRARFSAAFLALCPFAIVYFLDFVRSGIRDLDEWELDNQSREYAETTNHSEDSGELSSGKKKGDEEEGQEAKSKPGEGKSRHKSRQGNEKGKSWNWGTGFASSKWDASKKSKLQSKSGENI